MQNVINLTQGETGANLNRVRWAQTLIEQLAPWHDGRDSWLLNYGVGETYQHMRDARNLPWSDFYQCSTAQPSPPRLWEKPPIATCAQCGRLLCEMSSRGRCVFCEEKRASVNAKENDRLRDELAAANEQIAALCGQLSNAQADIAFYQENAADALTAKDQVEALREALDVANQEIKRLESSPKIMRGALVFKAGTEVTRACLANVLRRVEQMEAEAAAIAAEKDELQAELDSYKKRYTSAKVMPGSMPEGLTVGEALLGCGVGVSLTAEQSKELSDKIAEIKADRDKWAGMVKKATDAARQIIEINLGRYGVNDDQKKG